MLLRDINIRKPPDIVGTGMKLQSTIDILAWSQVAIIRIVIMATITVGSARHSPTVSAVR